MGTLAIKIPKWDIEEETGYKPFKTHLIVLLMRGKVIISTSQSLCLC